MSLSDPTYPYLSTGGYREQSLQPSLVDPRPHAQLASLILEVMVDIDRYIGDGWLPYDYLQEFTFPRDIDTDVTSTPTIPRDVGIATRMIADAPPEQRMHEGHPAAGDRVRDQPRALLPEAEAFDRRHPGFEYWPDEAFSKLDHYRRTGGSLAVSNPDVLGYPHAQ